MASDETLLSYLDWKILVTLRIYVSDKKLSGIIIQYRKPIAFLSRISSNPQRNYTMTKNELISIVKCLKLFRGINFVYEINVFSNHKNLVNATILSESQWLMC